MYIIEVTSMACITRLNVDILGENKIFSNTQASSFGSLT